MTALLSPSSQISLHVRALLRELLTFHRPRVAWHVAGIRRAISR
jgi:hypothetical protein